MPRLLLPASILSVARIAAGTLAAAVCAATALPALAQPVSLAPRTIQVASEGGELRNVDAALPYRWDRHHRHSGSASFEFVLPPMNSEQQHALHLGSVGSSYRIWLDGRLVREQRGRGERWTNTSHLAQRIPLPPTSGGLLRIDIGALAGADAGLSSVTLGTRDEIDTLHQTTQGWRLAAIVFVAIASMVLGTLGFVVWLNQRDPLYLSYAIAEWFWSLRTTGYYLVQDLPLPWPWWGAVLSTLYFGAILAICWFSLLLVDRWHRPWNRILQVFLALSIAVLAIAYTLELHDLRRYWRTALFAVGAASAVVVLLTARHRRSHEALLIGTAFLLVLAVGARDWYVFTIAPPSASAISWFTFVWVLFGLFMVWLLASRLRDGARAQEAHPSQIMERLAAQELVLERAFAVQRRHTEQQAATEERRRVLQDMHDGVGHELLGALQLAQEGGTARAAVTDQIQRAMDHLKLTVDALQEGSEDMGTMLGLLRYRLTPRLQAAGIEVEWQVAPIQPIDGWDTRRTRDLQLLLYEAFSNLLLHSGARRTRFSAAYDQPAKAIRIVLEDDGRGFHPGSVAGHGLGSMRSRAVRLGARLSIGASTEAAFPGACLSLEIPALPAAPSSAAAFSGPDVSG